MLHTNTIFVSIYLFCPEAKPSSMRIIGTSTHKKEISMQICATMCGIFLENTDNQ